jgi:hypothetical protein
MINKSIFLISIPKSGTYFFSEVLKNLGYRQSFMHIDENGYHQYEITKLEDGRKNPDKFYIRSEFTRSISLLKHNDFAVSHLEFKPEYYKLLDKFQIVLLTREIRECIVSVLNFLIFSERIKRYKDADWARSSLDFSERLPLFIRSKFMEKELNKWNHIHLWLGYKNIIDVKFNELYYNTLSSFMHFKEKDLKEAITLALKAETLTRSNSKTDLNKTWSEIAEKELINVIDKLNLSDLLLINSIHHKQ